MYGLVFTSQFRKDLKKISRSGKYNISELQSVIDILLSGRELERKFKSHRLTGNWSEFMECHIRPDWLLIYFIDTEKNRISLVRTGSHSELFR